MPADRTIGAAIITRDDLPSLKNLLAQLSRLDQVVVLDTGSNDGTADHVRSLGAPFELRRHRWRPRPNGHGPNEWGFAAARNASFSHLETTHAIWLDSDDILVRAGAAETLGPETAASGLRSLIASPLDIDVWQLQYIYAVDEFGNATTAIRKDRLLRLGAGWRWRHPVHEVLFSKRDPGTTRAAVVNDLGVLHRQANPTRSTARNGPMILDWLRQLEQTPGVDRADLGRARFTYGRWLRGQGHFDQAADWMLREFLAKHADMTPEDRWEGWLEVAKDLVQAEDPDGARHAALEGIAACPRFGETYVVLAGMKLREGDPPADVLKLLEIADSCADESYGQHEHSPLLTEFNSIVFSAAANARLGRHREALTMADRALNMRPTDEGARQAWAAAAAGARSEVSRLRDFEAAPAVSADGARREPHQRPIFVVSSGRCGSTLVSNMLRLHAEVLSLSEFMIMLMPGAFMHGTVPISGAQLWSILNTPRKRFTLMQRHDIVFEEVLYRPGPGKRFTIDTGVPPILLTALPQLSDDPEALYDEIREWVADQATYPVGLHYVHLFEWLKSRLGRKVYVERSGSSLVHLEELMANFPNARFVHMYRDGRECAMSMSRHSAFRLSMISGQLMRELGVDPFNTDEQAPASIPAELQKFMPESFDREAFWQFEAEPEKFGAGWSAQETKALDALSKLSGDRVMHLSYEDLVGKPHLELTRILRFIGAAVDSDYLDKAAALVKIKAASWPQLPPPQRRKLNQACRVGLALLYGVDVEAEMAGARAIVLNPA